MPGADWVRNIIGFSIGAFGLPLGPVAHERFFLSVPIYGGTDSS